MELVQTGHSSSSCTPVAGGTSGPATVGGSGDDCAEGGGGGQLEERARELRRRGGGAFVVVLLHAVGVGHALDAVQLHGPHQIEPDLRLPTREPPEKPLLLRQTTAKGM